MKSKERDYIQSSIRERKSSGVWLHRFWCLLSSCSAFGSAICGSSLDVAQMLSQEGARLHCHSVSLASQLCTARVHPLPLLLFSLNSLLTVFQISFSSSGFSCQLPCSSATNLSGVGSKG